MTSHKPLTRGARITALLLLIWNLIGVAALIAQATADLNALARTDAYQAHLFATMPVWAWVAYAVGVFAGLAGTVALLFRSRWAVPLYMLSLVAIILQFGRTFLLTDLIAMRGLGTTAFPAFIILVAIAQIWFAMKLRRNGVLR